jgi:hypothetical protein
MDWLVLCPCGHALTSHDWEGCRGDRFAQCACVHSPQSALDAAIEASRLKTGPEELLTSK